MRNAFEGRGGMRSLGDLGAAKRAPSVPLDPATGTAKELNALQSGFAARAQAENARRELATDSEYWCCLVFQTRAQAEAFAARFAGPDEKYLDGLQVAKALSIDLPPDPQFGRVKVDRRLSEMT